MKMNPLLAVVCYLFTLAAITWSLRQAPGVVPSVHPLIAEILLGSYALACTVVSVGLLAVLITWNSVLKSRLFSWLINRGRIEIPNKDQMRRAFSSMHIRREQEKANHTHGLSAGRRTVAKRFMTDFGFRVNLKPFQVQQSANDQKHGVEGNRTFYWSKDMNTDCNFSMPKDSNVICMTDVDYYIDMPWFLAWNAKPTLLYTFVPSSLACSNGESSYMFNADNTVQQHVSGGATYRHQLWNYGSDNCVATWRILGIPIITTTYLIERRNIDDDHQVLFFCPSSYFWGPFAWLAEGLDGYRVQRLKVVDGEYTRMYVQDKNKLMVCTGVAGEFIGAKVPVEQDAAVRVVSRLMKNDITPPTVQTYTGSGLDKRSAAAVICAYHRAQTGFKPPCVFPVSYAVKDYTFKPEEFYEHAKPMLKAFMSPLIDACYVPTDCLANEQVGLEERVTKILTDVPMPDSYLDFAHEFVELLVPEPGCAVPASMDEVYDRQNRPSQRRLIDEGCWYGEDMESMRKVAAFNKAEAHAEPKPPRNISTVNPRDKIDYSCFTYAAAEVLKRNAKWYAFGKTPKDIAARVAEICQHARKHGVNSDLSKFDGRLSEAFRFLEHIFLLRVFPNSYSEEVTALHQSQFGLRGRGRNGTQYETGFSRLSGSPETALFNSLANAFMVFVTLRLSKLNPKAAWAALGIYGGDDGLTMDLDVKRYTEVATKLGMKTTTEEIKRGEMGVKFLARIYSQEVWDGSPNSCCDILRQLGKFHATANLPQNVSASQKLIEKARGFFLSDPNTPVIGDLAKRVMQLTTSSGVFTKSYSSTVKIAGGKSSVTHQGSLSDIAAQSVIDSYSATSVRNYASCAAPDEQYPNEDSCWMKNLLTTQIPTFDFERFNKTLASASTVEDLLKFPLCAEPIRPPVTLPVVVQDEVLLPETIVSVESVATGVQTPAVPAAVVSAVPPRVAPSTTVANGETVERGRAIATDHATHGYLGDPRGCFKCHPEKRPTADHSTHRWGDQLGCWLCHPELAKTRDGTRGSRSGPRVGAKPSEASHGNSPGKPSTSHAGALQSTPASSGGAATVSSTVARGPNDVPVARPKGDANERDTGNNNAKSATPPRERSPKWHKPKSNDDKRRDWTTVRKGGRGGGTGARGIGPSA